MLIVFIILYLFFIITYNIVHPISIDIYNGRLSTMQLNIKICTCLEVVRNIQCSKHVLTSLAFNIHDEILNSKHNQSKYHCCDHIQIVKQYFTISSSGYNECSSSRRTMAA